MKRFLLIPVILILLAFSAYAASLAVDGGVLQAFQIEVRLGVPVADAGDDQSVAIGESVTLDGTGSTDPDGGPLTYNWTLDVPSGSSAALDDATLPTPGFVADVAGTYTAELTVSDGQFVSPPDTVLVTVEDTVSATAEALPGITLANLELPTYSTATLTVILSEPAEAGGQEVALTSDPAVLTFDFLPVTIPEGATQADVTVTSGSSDGVASITATGPGLTDGTALITIVARAMILQIEDAGIGTVLLDDPAPDGGITITVTSSDPMIVGVQPATIAIDQGQTAGSFSMTGLAEGTVLITASAPGYANASAAAAVTPAP